MDTNTILLIINIAASVLITPLVSAFVACLRRVKKSDCCGNHIELAQVSTAEIKV